MYSIHFEHLIILKIHFKYLTLFTLKGELTHGIMHTHIEMLFVSYSSK